MAYGSGSGTGTASGNNTVTFKGFSSRADKQNFKIYDFECAKQDLINRLSVRKGERVENPEFGTIIYDALFEPLTDALKEQTTASWATGWAAGDYLMFAIDIDGGKFYFGANGTWDAGASNDPAAGTGGYTFVPGGELYTPVTTIYRERLEMNFGNGYFTTSAIGSPNADANGEGAFKYAPPTGFYALCTNNLKLYGGA